MLGSLRSCPTRIRTWTDRTKIWSAAITPLDKLTFLMLGDGVWTLPVVQKQGAKVLTFLRLSKTFFALLGRFTICGYISVSCVCEKTGNDDVPCPRQKTVDSVLFAKFG